MEVPYVNYNGAERPRRGVFTVTTVAAAAALICAVLAFTATSGSSTKAMAWGVSKATLANAEVAMYTNPNGMVMETRDAHEVALKAVSWEDVDCPDEGMCSGCDEATTNINTSMVAAMITMALSLYCNRRRAVEGDESPDAAHLRKANVVTALTAAVALLHTVLTFTNSCYNKTPSSLNGVDMESSLGQGWSLIVLSVVLEVAVACVHALNPVLAFVGRNDEAAVLAVQVQDALDGRRRAAAAVAAAPAARKFAAPVYAPTRAYRQAATAAPARSLYPAVPTGSRQSGFVGAPARQHVGGFTSAAAGIRRRGARVSNLSMMAVSLGEDDKVVVIGVAADSGCGKSTFMRRLTKIFGGDPTLADIGRETNTLISDDTTVICLDDYHKYDRTGRSENNITALHADCQKWDLMAEQVLALKDKKSVQKPIYNHITGALDEPEPIDPTKIMIFEGLHPFYDDRVRNAMDFKIYLDISDDIKFAWKMQRDAEERGWSEEEIRKQIEGRKGDFSAFVEPQRAQADVLIQVLPSEMVDDPTGKYLKTRFIQKKGVGFFSPAFLLGTKEAFTWHPDPAKRVIPEQLESLGQDFLDDLTEGMEAVGTTVGLKLSSYEEDFLGAPCEVLEMDGDFTNLEKLDGIERLIHDSGTKFHSELMQQMVANKDSPGSFNGTGFFQTLCAFKLREVYEAASGEFNIWEAAKEKEYTYKPADLSEYANSVFRFEQPQNWPHVWKCEETGENIVIDDETPMDDKPCLPASTLEEIEKFIVDTYERKASAKDDNPDDVFPSVITMLRMSDSEKSKMRATVISTNAAQMEVFEKDLKDAKARDDEDDIEVLEQTMTVLRLHTDGLDDLDDSAWLMEAKRRIDGPFYHANGTTGGIETKDQLDNTDDMFKTWDTHEDRIEIALEEQLITNEAWDRGQMWDPIDEDWKETPSMEELLLVVTDYPEYIDHLPKGVNPETIKAAIAKGDEMVARDTTEDAELMDFVINDNPVYNHKLRHEMFRQELLEWEDPTAWVERTGGQMASPYPYDHLFERKEDIPIWTSLKQSMSSFKTA